MIKKIEVSHKTIIFAALFLILLWFLYFIREIILQVFVALLIMAILNPLVTRLSTLKLKLPRVLVTAVVYIVLIAILSGIGAILIPPLVEQTGNFATSLPRYLDAIKLPPVVTDQVARELTAQLGRLPSQVLKVGISVFSNILSVLAVFIFAFYLLLARDRLEEGLVTFLGKEKGHQFAGLVDQLEAKMGGWARAQLIVMFLMGAIMYVGLLLLGVPFALPLAVLVGLLEIVPTLGPILAVIPAIIVGFNISAFTGLAVAALSFLLHQLENYVFVPNVIKRSVGISPLVTLLALIIGFKLAGVVGAILAVPVVITLQILGKEFVFGK